MKRLFDAPAARGIRLGARLMGELERLARGHGLSVLRLDTATTSSNPTGCATLRYEEVPPFNDGLYADHWLAKPLAQ